MSTVWSCEVPGAIDADVLTRRQAIENFIADDKKGQVARQGFDGGQEVCVRHGLGLGRAQDRRRLDQGDLCGLPQARHARGDAQDVAHQRAVAAADFNQPEGPR